MLSKNYSLNILVCNLSKKCILVSELFAVQYTLLENLKLCPKTQLLENNKIVHLNFCAKNE